MNMMDELFESVNMLDWHNARLLSYIPPHFTSLKMVDDDDRLAQFKWLEENTRGRFGIEHVVDIEPKNRFVTETKLRIGFEDPSEATMYALFFSK